MEPELSLLSPPATPPLELNKVSQSTFNSSNTKNRLQNYNTQLWNDKGYSSLSEINAVLWIGSQVEQSNDLNSRWKKNIAKTPFQRLLLLPRQ